MYVSLCSVLPPENWSAYLPNKGNSSSLHFTKIRSQHLQFLQSYIEDNQIVTSIKNDVTSNEESTV